MKLTAPLHVLKNKAKKLKHSQSITLTEALDIIARTEGFCSWSLLQSKVRNYQPQTVEELLEYLHPGDLLLIGARPGLGKTKITLQLLLQAIKEKRPCYFFSLEFSMLALENKLIELDDRYQEHKSLLKLDVSDEISASYIVGQTKETISEGSLIAIDYLQLLDQARSKPPLQSQIEELKVYAKETGSILIFISQIDRAFEEDERANPCMTDVRTPNSLDLSLFNKSIFVQDDRIST